MDYNKICQRLGFRPEVNFVKIAKNGSIGFTLGKPSELEALYAACRREGLTPSRKLIAAIKKSNAYFTGIR